MIADRDTRGFQITAALTVIARTPIGTPNLILGQGRGQGGASYSWSDTTAQPGITYAYWLVETEVNGTTNQYGPARGLPRTESNSIHVPASDAEMIVYSIRVRLQAEDGEPQRASPSSVFRFRPKRT